MSSELESRSAYSNESRSTGIPLLLRGVAKGDVYRVLFRCDHALYRADMEEADRDQFVAAFTAHVVAAVGWDAFMAVIAEYFDVVR